MQIPNMGNLPGNALTSVTVRRYIFTVIKNDFKKPLTKKKKK